MKIKFSALLILFLLTGCVSHQPQSYDALQKQLIQGWNTWDNRSVITQVLMPQGLAITVQVHDTLSGDSLYMAFTGNQVKGSEQVRVHTHLPDGSFTDLSLVWKDFGLRIQSAAEGKNLSLLITPDTDYPNPGFIKLTGDILYEREGKILTNANQIHADLPGLNWSIRSAGDNAPLIQPLNRSIAYSSQNKSLDDVIRMMTEKEAAYQTRVKEFGDMADVYDAVQNVLNWLVVYDSQKDRAVSPVARPWSYGWGNRQEGGYVLFCWDNFFAAYMHSIESKSLAYNEAIQMCKEIDELGFVPNFSAPNGLKSRDRSQPPVGSMMVREIYRRHPETWFLETVFDQLLTWNRWWARNRDHQGYLCWGSNPFKLFLNDRREKVQHDWQAASYESGLDNSPMFDDVPFNEKTHLMEQADVGLMGLYIGDCEALMEIADILGKPNESEELRVRAEKYRKILKTMWSEEFGMFLNKRTDTGELNPRISPTNFYALIGRAATQAQAERMMAEHFYNPDEFWGDWIMPSIARNDPAYTGEDYWRGSIWAPMNFLVYLGLLNYDLPEARKDMADKSKALLLKSWHENRWVRENYHAETGGAPSRRSNPFYHWGALLGMINLIESGYVASPL